METITVPPSQNHPITWAEKLRSREAPALGRKGCGRIGVDTPAPHPVPSSASAQGDHCWMDMDRTDSVVWERAGGVSFFKPCPPGGSRRLSTQAPKL